MSGQSSRRDRSYYPIPTRSPLDQGQMYGPAREMGPPPLDWPPQPVEMDPLSNSRTLPSPQTSMSASNAWDALLQPPPYGELSYGSSNHARPQQLPMDGPNRASPPAQLPLVQWYMGNDGPWFPKGISEIVPDDRSQSRHIDNRNHLAYTGQYKAPNPSDPGSFQYGAPHSDSGYGTRRSDGNPSVFTADVPERDQDCQSLQGHVPDYQAFPVLNDMLQRDVRTTEPSWSYPTSSPSDSSKLICPTCRKQVKTQSELKKHDLRHRKPFMCKIPGCSRTEGFSTTNDLERHIKSKHPSAMSDTAMTKKFRCLVSGCKSKEKSWPRLDNFRSHLKRVHGNQLRYDDDFDDLIRRGEYVERNGLTIQDKEPTPQRPNLLEAPRTMRADIRDTQPSHLGETNWKPKSLYPEVIESSQDFVAPKGPQPDFESKVAVANESSESQTPQQETVQPLEVFRTQSGILENRITVDNVLVPVGQKNSTISKVEPASSQAVPRGSTTGKAPRQTPVSASDATILGVVKQALAGANITDVSPDRATHQDSERNHLPNGRLSSGDQWPAGPSSAMPTSNGANGRIKPTDVHSPEEAARDSEAQKKALEVLKVIRELGYIVQKDTTHTPKPHNLGSAASNRSEHQVTCQTCKRFTGRPCELKKHMKRHERPYGCTFLTCNKTFGSKNDWKRHENSQHFHLETWRCDEERLEGGACAKVCYRRQTFQEHLVKAHQMVLDSDPIRAKLDNCRIGRNCQSRFWCGFCNSLVDLKKRGVDAWTERFDHIDDHFMGRHNLPKQSIQDWVPMDSDRPKGEVESPQPHGPQDEDGPGPSQSATGSPTGNPPESKASTGGSPGITSNHEEGHAGPSTKRCRPSGGDDRLPAQKRAKPDTVVYCCQCNAPHNPRIDMQCTGCLEQPHEFCSNCKAEPRTPGDFERRL